MVTMTTESDKDKIVASVMPKKNLTNIHSGPAVCGEDAPNILVYKKVRYII